MGVRRTAIVKNYKDASYLMFGGNGSGANIQLAMQREKDKKKQEVKEQLKEYKRQLEIKEEIRKQGAKIDAEIKQTQLQQNMIDPKVWDTHTRNISSPKLKNIFKDVDSKHRYLLCDVIAREERDNPKEDNFIVKIIKNIGKKKPPKNMTIVQ